MRDQPGDGLSHTSSGDLPIVEFVTESGARRRIAYERDASAGVVRHEWRHDGDEWVTVGAERVRALEIDGEARMPVDVRTAVGDA